jgi:ribulose-phosphate 3-epimerase
MIKIAPSILTADLSNLQAEIQRLEAAGADYIHLDVMDGHFVPNLTFGPPFIKSLRKCTKLPFDVHLMIENPERSVEQYIQAGADIVTVHVETGYHQNRTLRLIRQLGAKPGAVLNPATPLSEVEWLLDEVDMVLLMSVNPGFGGQSYIANVTRKIAELKRMITGRGLAIDIQVDGGVSVDNIREVTQAGANVIVSGSAVFNAPDMTAYIRELKDKAFQ